MSPTDDETTPAPSGDVTTPDTHSARFVYQMSILMAMNRNPKISIYEGTVPAAVVAKRRAKNRKAKQARKVNR